jgi:hypothetical protein
VSCDANWLVHSRFGIGACPVLVLNAGAELSR